MNDAGNDPTALAERIDALEIRLTYQDEIIETLNKTVTDQWAKISALTRLIENLGERLTQAESLGPPGPANEPPPHY